MSAFRAVHVLECQGNGKTSGVEAKAQRSIHMLYKESSVTREPGGRQYLRSRVRSHPSLGVNAKYCDLDSSDDLAGHCPLRDDPPSIGGEGRALKHTGSSRNDAVVG